MISGKYLRMIVMLSIMVLLSGFTSCGEQKNTDESTSVAEDTAIAEEQSRVTLTAERETAATEELQPRDQIMEESVGNCETKTSEETAAPQDEVPAETAQSQPVEYTNLQQITLDSTWEYADHSKINSGAAVLYLASEQSGRKGIVIGVNAGHGTAGGAKVKTLCHPDGSAKVTGGSTAAGATEAAAVSGGRSEERR